MAKKAKAPFSPPTQADLDALGAERVRAGPRGGFIWLCEVAGCKVAASHLTAQGRKVCHRHGGSTKKKRDVVAQAEAKAKGEEVKAAPGRPVRHGFYATVPGVKVDEVVADYRARKLNPDATEDDMLYLRAYLDELKEMRPDGAAVAELLRAALDTVGVWLEQHTDVTDEAKGVTLTVGQVLNQLGAYEDLSKSLKPLKQLLGKLLELTAGVEERHKNLVLLAKVRAETRLKDSAAQQIDAFTALVERLVIINNETLPSHYAEALNLRYAKELNEIPANGIKVKS